MKCQGLGSVHVGLAEARSWSQDAIAYAWLIDDAFIYAIAAGAGDDASTDDPCSPACIDTLQPFLGDDIRPCRGLQRRFVPAISANVLQCTAHCTSPPPKPIDAIDWRLYVDASRSRPACATRIAECGANARRKPTRRVQAFDPRSARAMPGSSQRS